MPKKSKLPNSGGKTVRRLAWMCNSRSLGKKPISFGMSIKSFSRRTNYNKKKYFNSVKIYNSPEYNYTESFNSINYSYNYTYTLYNQLNNLV